MRTGATQLYSILMKYYRAAEMLWPQKPVLQM